MCFWDSNYWPSLKNRIWYFSWTSLPLLACNPSTFLHGLDMKFSWPGKCWEGNRIQCFLYLGIIKTSVVESKPLFKHITLSWGLDMKTFEVASIGRAQGKILIFFHFSASFYLRFNFVLGMDVKFLWGGNYPKVGTESDISFEQYCLGGWMWNYLVPIGQAWKTEIRIIHTFLHHPLHPTSKLVLTNRGE